DASEEVCKIQADGQGYRGLVGGKMPEWIEVFVGGEIYRLKNKPESLEKFREKYRIEDDEVGWALAILMKKGLIDFHDKEGRRITDEALEAAENTLKILGKTWEDVYKVAGGR
ncbi:MAG: hypothetical protein QW290_08900, partial [Sulfolobales archaeon]